MPSFLHLIKSLRRYLPAAGRENIRGPQKPYRRDGYLASAVSRKRLQNLSALWEAADSLLSEKTADRMSQKGVQPDPAKRLLSEKKDT